MNKRTLRYKEYYTGKTFETNSCGKCTIILFEDSRNVTVKFHDYPYVVKSNLTNVKAGKLLNPMYPSCCGIGYVGVGKYLASDKKVYWSWYAMIQRVYSEKHRGKFIAYEGAEVCEDWLNFQNYAAWCYSQKFFKNKDENGKVYHLDKDLLFKGNKVYSPETCCFIPHEINSIIQSANLGKQPSGIYFRESRGMYEAAVRIGGKKVALGAYKTPEEAFYVYKKAKESYIKEVAEKWKGKIEDRVYEALMNYEVTKQGLSDGKN